MEPSFQDEYQMNIMNMLDNVLEEQKFDTIETMNQQCADFVKFDNQEDLLDANS